MSKENNIRKSINIPYRFNRNMSKY